MLPGHDFRQARWAAARFQPAIFMLSDVAAFVLAFLLSFELAGHLGASPNVTVSQRIWSNVAAEGQGWHGWGALLLLIVLLSQFSARNHYSQRTPFWMAARDVTAAGMLALLCDSVLAREIYHVPFGAEQVARWIMFIPLVLLFRQAVQGVLTRMGLWTLRTVVIGPEAQVARITAALRSERHLGYEVVAALDWNQLCDGHATAAEWSEKLAPFSAHYVMLATDAHASGKETAIAMAVRSIGLPFATVLSTGSLPVMSGRPNYFLSHNILMLCNRSSLADTLRRGLKRVLDTVCAALLVAMLSPLLLALAWLVRKDGGPALYRHKRLGANGTTFGCIKFRSMVTDGDRVLKELLASDPDAAAEWDATQKLRDDPRITPVGKFLRKTSLDELPQLLNVLRGEMSLIGPRPIVQSETRFYGDYINDYYAVRPGVTGLWQVSGRSDTSYEHRVQLDVWYVRNWTLWHDAAILLKTIPVVLLRRGAV